MFHPWSAALVVAAALPATITAGDDVATTVTDTTKLIPCPMEMEIHHKIIGDLGCPSVFDAMKTVCDINPVQKNVEIIADGRCNFNNELSYYRVKCNVNTAEGELQFSASNCENPDCTSCDTLYDGNVISGQGDRYIQLDQLYDPNTRCYGIEESISGRCVGIPYAFAFSGSCAENCTAAPTTSPTVSLVPTISAAPTAKSTPKPTRGPDVCDWYLEVVRGSDSYIACSGDEESESKVIADGKCNENSDIGYYKAFCKPGRGIEFVAVHCSNSDCTGCGGGNGDFMKSGEMYLSYQCNEVGEKGDPNRIGFELAGTCSRSDNCATSDASQGPLKTEMFFGTLLSVVIALSIV